MNKLIHLSFTTLLSVSITGCSSYFNRSIDTEINKMTGDTIATIIVWSNDSNAAIINKEGKVCMQNALAIKTTNSTADVKLSEALLKLSRIASKELNDNSKSNKESLLAVTASIDQAATLLTTTTERTSFLNTGMYYLCQISANGNLEKDDVEKVLAKLITSASKLTKKNAVGQ